MLPFWELTESQRQYRLDRARTLAEQESVRHGIGMQSEKTLHATMKFYFDENPDHHEIPIPPYIADLYHPELQEVIEIQTGSFGPLREKLEHFLPELSVTIVHPIPHIKWITRIDENGELSQPHKSPRKGKLWDFLPELYRISDYLLHPHLSILPVLVDVDEIRMLPTRRRSPGARIDRSVRSVGESRLIQRPEEYAALLPELPETFRAKDFQKAAGFSPRETGYALIALRRLNVLEITEKVRNAYLYRIHPSLRAKNVSDPKGIS